MTSHPVNTAHLRFDDGTEIVMPIREAFRLLGTLRREGWELADDETDGDEVLAAIGVER
jgi:hypothetical protein